MEYKIALIGRPNVGKSALFNRICQKRIAIVDEEEGVTRDRLYAPIEFLEKSAALIDTGGIDPYSNRDVNQQVLAQSKKALDEADFVIMVVDAIVGPTLLDKEIARLLLQYDKKIVLAINKVDDPSKEDLAHRFYSLGVQELVTVSAAHGHNIKTLMEKIFCHVPQQEKISDQKEIKVALIGKTNVGKSTLFNALINEERAVVSPKAATTRDSINTLVTYEGNRYIFIDTAGIRKKSKEETVIEKFASIRTEEAIYRADICLIMIDSLVGMTTFDKRIIHEIEKAKKGAIFIINKWDLIKDVPMEHYRNAVKKMVPYFHYPICFISAQTKRNISEIFPLIDAVKQNLLQTISTPDLNKFIQKCMQKYAPPQIDGKRLRIYYLIQKSVNPQVFLLFVNYADLLLPTYKKYLINAFRKEYGFKGVPILFQVRNRLQKK